MSKIKIGVVFGGRSGEHEVSVRSANNVIKALNQEKYEIVPLAIAKNGKWLNSYESIKLLPETTQALLSENLNGSSGENVALIGDPTRQGLTVWEKEFSSKPLDVVFPVLHGTYGEDGTIQGLFEMANIPYVGCGVLSSACGMDKVTMKKLFRDAGLPQCKYVWFLRGEFAENEAEIIGKIKKELSFPCFVKPANLGSSVGISKAKDEESLKKGIELAAKFDRKIIVEEGLEMREIECAILGNDEPEASLPGEYIIFDESKAFLDYTEKYKGTGNNAFVTPARISAKQTKQVQDWAKTAFKAVDGAGLARVDFFLLNQTGEILINEINTLPGMTDSSGYPKMWAASGKTFPQVVDKLVELAIERHADKAQNLTSL